MWNTSDTREINESRTVVLGESGRTDSEATLYMFGSQTDRLAWANMMLDVSLKIQQDARKYRADYPQASADIMHAMNANASVISTKALHMVHGPYGADVSVGVTVLNPNGRPVELTAEGWDGSGTWFDIKGNEYSATDILGFRILD